MKINCDCGEEYTYVEEDGAEEWMTCPNCDLPYKYIGIGNPKWIHIENKMPFPGACVIVATLKKVVPAVFMGEDRTDWMFLTYTEDTNVTHWMELPDLPEG